MRPQSPKAISEEKSSTIKPLFFCAVFSSLKSNQATMESHFKEGDVVEVARKKEGFEGSWYIATILRCLKMKNKMSFLIKYHRVLYNQDSTSTPLRKFINADDIRPQPPLEKTAYFRLNEQVDAFFENGWWFGVIIKVLDGIGGYSVHLSTKKLEKEFGPAELRRHLEWVDGAWVGFQEQETLSIQQNQSRVESLVPTWSSPASSIETVGPPSPSALEDYLRKLSQSSPRHMYQNMDAPLFSNKSISLRKRKIELSTTKISDLDPGNACGTAMSHIVVPTADYGELSSHTADEHSPLSGLFQKSNYLPLVDNGVLPGNGGIILKEENIQKDAAECIHLQKSLDVVGCSSNLDIQTALDGDSNARRVMVRESTSSSPTQVDEGALTRSLPFTKTLPLWDIIDSMDVFQRIPQQPHFRPLEEYNEELRQGLAIGYMMSFANLVTGKIEEPLDGPQKSLEGKLFALLELEKHGFTVQPLKSGLEDLLRFKDKYRQFDDELKAIHDQIIEKRKHMDRLEAKIDELKETIIELNKKLQAVTVEKERKLTAVAELNLKLKAIKESIRSTRLNFDGILAAHLKCFL